MSAECFNSLSHGFGAVAAGVLVHALFRRTRLWTLVVFGSGVVLCFCSSALFHGLLGSVGDTHGPLVVFCRRLDRSCIFLMVAGTYTPVIWELFRHSWRRWVLTAVWTVALLGMTRIWVGPEQTIAEATAVLAVLGWGSLLGYPEMLRTRMWSELWLLPLGGMFYTVGAVLNVVCGWHGLFHMLTISGFLTHYLLIRGLTSSAEPARGRRSGPRGSVASRPRRRAAAW